MSTKVSITEAAYISSGVEAGLRADGRDRRDYRQLLIETRVSAQMSGSCRVQLAGTDILVNVKAEIGTVNLHERNAFDRGKVVCSTSFSPSVTRNAAHKQTEDLTVSLNQFLNRLLNTPASGLDLQALCIVPGASFWVLAVDVLVLGYAGNLYDAVCIAVKGALHSTRLPLCVIEQVGGKYEFDISDEETETIKGVDNVPLCITLNKIGNRYVVDCTLLEEACVETKIVVAINPQGNICSIVKDGEGCVDPSLLAEMLDQKDLSLAMFASVDAVLAREDERYERGDPVVMFAN